MKTENKTEQWKRLDCRGEYYISSFGRVKSAYSNKERFLKGNITGNKYNAGYLYVKIPFIDKYKNLFIHRLVAQYFIPNPETLPQVNHLNGNPHDNRAENLEWISAKDNIGHAWDNGLVKRVLQGSHKRITDRMVLEVRELRSKGNTIKHISQQVGISIRSVNDILRYRMRFSNNQKAA
jgi:hypothetical protein